jgi:hypothetical protein
MARVERLLHDYKAAGGKMEESEVVLRALTNLPTSVKAAFSSVVVGEDTSSLTFAAITPRLLALDSFIAPKQHSTTALFAGSSSRSRGSYRGHGGRHNFGGGRGASGSRAVSTSHGSHASGSQGSNECTYCGHKGPTVDIHRRKQRDLRDGKVRDRVPDHERTVGKHRQQGSNTVTAAAATTATQMHHHQQW